MKSLEQRLDATFWSSALVKNHSTRPSGVRLSPLPSSPARNSSAGLSADSPGGAASSSAVAQSPARRSTGRLGDLMELRRSAPAVLDWLASAKDVSGEAGRSTPQRMHPSLRMKRNRRPADYGAGLCFGSRGRGRSCTSLTAEASHASRCMSGETGANGSSSSRCSSVPPIGTDKADEEAAAKAKTNAVAALQRLFFEEMAKEGQDANEAAARALRRLTEASSRPSSPDGHAVSDSRLLEAPRASADVCMNRCVPRRPVPMEGQRPRGTLVLESVKA